jgi:hypothetical protein
VIVRAIAFRRRCDALTIYQTVAIRDGLVELVDLMRSVETE